jgi:hypothetical protein
MLQPHINRNDVMAGIGKQSGVDRTHGAHTHHGDFHRSIRPLSGSRGAAAIKPPVHEQTTVIVNEITGEAVDWCYR